VRDWWTFESPFGPSTYVITGDQGGDWFFDTDNQDTAFFNAQTDISRLGPVRKSDLAGSQGGDRVDFFHWPPTENETWDTQWDYQPVTITTVEVTNTTATYEATNATGLVYRYVYDSEVEWFAIIESFAPDGTVGFTFEHSDHGSNYTGEVYRWTLEDLYEFEGTGPMQAGVDNVAVPAGMTDLWLSAHIDCPSNSGYTLAIGPVDASAATDTWEAASQCVNSYDFEDVIVEPPVAGTWLVAREWSGGPEQMFGRLHLLGRTLETIPIG
jgi:hypothetical protein